MISFTACTTKTVNGTVSENEGDSQMGELNERQIAICEEMGLPTEYDELTLKQLRNIQRIEELLCSLDKKYNETFHYVGYYEPFLEKEKLEAYSDRYSEYQFVTLTVEEDGTMNDNYPFVIASEMLTCDLYEFLRSETSFDYQIYPVFGDTGLKDTNDISLNTISGKTWISFTVIMEYNGDSDVSSFIGELLSQWYHKTGIYGSTNVIAIGSEAFAEINYENYQSVRRIYNVKNLVSCDVNAAGETTIH